MGSATTFVRICALACFALGATAGPALAVTIDTTPQQNDTLAPFGVPYTPTYGQVVTAPPGTTTLDSFTFVMTVPTNVVFRGEVYAWDGDKATGPNLYESAPQSTSSSVQQQTTFATAGVPVTPGAQYIVFASTSKDFEATTFSQGQWGMTTGDVYAGGDLRYMNNDDDVSAWTTQTWSAYSPGSDFAFKAVFGEGLPAAPVTRYVDDNQVQCPAAAYTTIQSAVDASGPGDTINVCRGTYNENVTVGAGKDNLTLNSYTAPVAAVVKGGFAVAGAHGVSILKFRVEPPAGADGISVGSGSSTALIRSNLVVGGKIGIHVANADGGTVRDNSLNGQTQQGIAVIAADGAAAKADVLNNALVGTAESSGIYLVSSGSGSNLSTNVFANTVSKSGVYGIYLRGSGGGTGTVAIKANGVSAGAAGISLGNLPAAVENNNVSTNTGTGISVGSGGYTFKSNNAKGNGGIDCYDESTGTGTAGTGNTWIANYGFDWNVTGICKKQ